MSRLVDKERLARLAIALDDRMKKAVAAEETARKAADEALQTAVKALEDANKEGGAVAEAIAAVQSALDEFETAQAVKDGEQDDAIETAQKAADDAKADVDAVEQRLDAEGGLVDRIAANEAFVAAQPAIDQAQDGRLAALEAKFAGDDSVDNKIAAAEAAAKQHAEDKDAVLKQELQDEIAAEVTRAKAAEQANADEMTKQKDAAQDGTLANKIAANAAAVAAEQQRAEGVEAELDQDIKDEATARANAVSAEAQAREAADNALDGRVAAIEASIGDGGNLEARVAANEDAIAVINGEGEGSIKKAVADLVDGAPEALDTLNELAAALRDNAGVLDAVEQAFDTKLATLQADVDQNEADCDTAVQKVASDLADQMNEGINGSLAHKIAAAQAAANKAQGEVDAVEERMNTAEGNISTLQGTVAQHATSLNTLNTAIETEKGRAEGQEAAIRGELADAIAKEVEDRDAAIKVEADRAKAEEADIRADFAQADTDLHATIKGEMAAVIQSLVAEITEDGMLRIALGGIQGDDVLVIREQEIPYVTDAEIDAIIAGLDAPAE